MEKDIAALREHNVRLEGIISDLKMQNSKETVPQGAIEIASSDSDTKNVLKLILDELKDLKRFKSDVQRS